MWDGVYVCFQLHISKVADPPQMTLLQKCVRFGRCQFWAIFTVLLLRHMLCSCSCMHAPISLIAVILQGNVDPMCLFGPEEVIRAEVERCLGAAGTRGHILNVGHGVIQVPYWSWREGNGAQMPGGRAHRACFYFGEPRACGNSGWLGGWVSCSGLCGFVRRGGAGKCDSSLLSNQRTLAWNSGHEQSLPPKDQTHFHTPTPFPSPLVPQGTPESSVALFCELARQSGNIQARATVANGVLEPVLA